MRNVLEGSAQGAFHFLTLAGEPGTGKTRLLGELTAANAGNVPVMSGRASEFEQELPFGVVIDALDDLVEEKLDELFAGFSPTILEQLALAFPAIARAIDDGPGESPRGNGGAGGLARYRLYSAIRTLIEQLASPGGLVILLDDLHWADVSSLELLDHLVRHPPRAGVLIAVTYRPAQVTPALAALTQSAGRHGPGLTLDPLTLGEVAEFLGPDVSRSRCAALHEASGGNPFYLDALVRMERVSPSSDHDELPLNVQMAVHDELSGLSTDQLVIARAAAIVADEFDPALVAAAARTTQEETLTALDQLVARDVMRPVPGGTRFTFRHPLIRHAVYNSAAAGWRLACHARVAGHLAELGASVKQRAHHVERSAGFGDYQAIGILIEAAREVTCQAPSTSARWLQSALRLMPHSSPERLSLMLELAHMQSVGGRLEAGRETATEVLRLLPRADYARRAKAVRFCVMTERLLGRIEQSHALLVDELRTIPDQQSPSAVRLRIRLVTDNLMRLDQDGAQALLDLAPRHPDTWEPSLNISLAALRPMAAYAAGSIDEALDHIKAVDHVLATAPDEHLFDCLDNLVWLGWTECLMGRNADALRHFDRLMAVAQDTGQQFIISVVLAGQAQAHLGLGRLADAAHAAGDALESARLLGSPQQSVFALNQACLIHHWSGDRKAALAHGETAVRTADGSGEEWWGKQTKYALALVLNDAGRRDEARELLLTACNGFAAPALDPNTLLCCAEQLAALEAAEGRPEESARWADQAAQHAYPSLPGTVGLATLARAHAELEREPDSAAANAREAAALLDEADHRLEAGRALLTAGVAAAKAEDRESARQSLQAAAETLQECGARFLHRRAVQEQRRLGVYVPAETGRAASPYGLSRRELEVAALVARGYTNLQIADSLVISVRTVETHLSHIFAKLGVTSRAGVVIALNPAT